MYAAPRTAQEKAPAMFIGHFAVALAAKRAAPAASLGTLFAAAQTADLLWPTFVLLHAEHVEIRPGATAVTPLEFVSYPYSHSLVALAVWGALFAGGYALVARARGRAGWAAPLTLFARVLSHWVLDVFTHAPDMPVTLTGPTRLGLGLWSSLPGTLVVELVMFALGLGIYVRATRARDRTGRLALAGLAVFLLVSYLANVFGPPPPSVRVIAWAGEAMWLLVLWAAWADRHRARPAALA
jgi:hypothetical protein